MTSSLRKKEPWVKTQLNDTVVDVDIQIWSRAQVRLFGPISRSSKKRPVLAYHALGLLHIDLVTNDDKGEVLGSTRGGLNQEFVSPALQGLETLCVVDVVHEHTAVGSTVKGNSQGLEALLSGSVPNLLQDGIKIWQERQHTEENITNTPTHKKYMSAGCLGLNQKKNVRIGSIMIIDGATGEEKRRESDIAWQREGMREKKNQARNKRLKKTTQ